LAQDPHYSQFFQTLHFANPSVISLSADAGAGILYRNQWPGLKSAFVTYNAFYLHPVSKLNSALGLTLTHDVQGDGIINKTLPAFIYSYQIKISEPFQVSAGMRAGYFVRSINEGKLLFETDITGNGNYFTGNEKLKSGGFDFSLGMTVSNRENFHTGFAVHHITTPNESTSGKEGGKLNYLFVFHSSGKIFISDHYRRHIALKPGGRFMKQGVNTLLLYGSNLQIYDFEFGLWARNDLHFRFDAVLFLLGFTREKYNFTYSYDVNLKNMKIFSPGIGAHEVTFLYNFKYKEKRKSSYNKYRKM
jgi:type IX secretion system PorP/SprF family membrane protein